MNLIDTLKGKRTYLAAAIAILYLIGCGLGFWAYNEQVLAIFGFSGLAFLRSALNTTALAAPPLPTVNYSGPTKPPFPLLVLLLLPALVLSGCVFAPKTHVHGKVMGEPFSIQTPKDSVTKGFKVEATKETNGTAHVTIQVDSLEAKMNPDVITAQGQAIAQANTAILQNISGMMAQLKDMMQMAAQAYATGGTSLAVPKPPSSANAK